MNTLLHWRWRGHMVLAVAYAPEVRRLFWWLGPRWRGSIGGRSAVRRPFWLADASALPGKPWSACLTQKGYVVSDDDAGSFGKVGW